MNLVRGKYYVNENDIIIQPFYMIDPLIKIFSELSYTNFISNLKITNKFLNDEIIEIIKSEKPQYKIDTSFVILINALNDMYSCEPFALTKDGKSALNEEEIFSYDYNCSGFKLPTKEQLELFKKENPKQYKKFESQEPTQNENKEYSIPSLSSQYIVVPQGVTFFIHASTDPQKNNLMSQYRKYSVINDKGISYDIYIYSNNGSAAMGVKGLKYNSINNVINAE
jgi:hypothetical protein